MERHTVGTAIPSDFMANPTLELRAYLSTLRVGALGEGMTTLLAQRFEMGRIAMALEIISVMKVLEDAGNMLLLSAGAEELVSVLRTLLVDQGLVEDAGYWYEMLSEWRRPKLIVDETAEHGALPPGNGGA